MSDQPDVSVIVAAWKAAGLVERAIASALASRGVTVEVVVVDDASPDDTWGVLQELAAKDPRVVIDRLPANGGPSAARNRAIKLTQGRYIAVLDADDTMAPDRLAVLVGLAEKHASDIVVDNMVEVDASGGKIGNGRFLKDELFEMQRTIDLKTWVTFNEPMKPGDCLGYLKPLIRKTTLEKYQASYDLLLRNSEDYYFVADLLARGARMTYTPTAGYSYTRAEGSISHRLKPEQTKAWLEAEKRFAARQDAHLTPLEHDALAQRKRALRKVNQLIAATEALKEKRIGAFLLALVMDVGAAGYTLATLARIALGKATGHKTV